MSRGIFDDGASSSIDIDEEEAALTDRMRSERNVENESALQTVSETFDGMNIP